MMGKVVRLAAASVLTPSERTRGARLTKRLVDQVRPSASGDRFVWDGELRGFGVRVKPSGVCTYVVQYRDGGGRTRRLALGRHGVLTTEQARKIAMRRLADVAGGGNPSVERKRERARSEGATVADVLKRYMAFVEQRRKPSTIQGYKAVLNRLLLPKLGKTLARDLTAHDVRDWHMRLSRTPITANRALALLSAAYVRSGYDNPCRKKLVERYPERDRKRFYSDDELGRVFAVLAEGERTRTIADGVVNAIRLLALTGCRLSEVTGLRWEHVDLATGVLRLPDAKAGARVVPLSNAACKLLASLPRTGQFVVSGRTAGEPLNKWTLESNWQRIRTQAGLENARLHDWRHTYGTHAGAAGLGHYLVRDLLGHKTLAMSNRYVTTDVDPARRAADQAVARIAAAMEKGKQALRRPARSRRR